MSTPRTITSCAMASGARALRKPLFGGNPGDFVKIRPCAEQFGNKTYLGILIGDLARGLFFADFDKETGHAVFDFAYYNPCILIPELGEVVLGSESWWGRIRTPEDLEDISDKDIDGVWYVQALKSLGDPD